MELGKAPIHKTQLIQVKPVLMVRDVPKALRFLARLGFGQTFVDDPATPRYAGVRRDEVEFHLQWHDAAEWAYPTDRPNYRLLVDDVDALAREFAAAGLAMTAVTDTDFGTREFHIQDEDSNGLQFYRLR